MAPISEERIEEEIDRSRSVLDATVREWSRIPPQRKPYRRLGDCARQLGVYHVLLGQYGEARHQFGEAARAYLEARKQAIGQVDEVVMLLWTLLSAVLSGEDERRRQAAESAAVVDNQEPEYFYNFDACLSHLIRGKDDQALTAANFLSGFERQEAQRLDYYNGLGLAARGIVTDNPEVLTAGLREMLQTHEILRRRFGEDADDALVCIPATALLVLASERGIDVSALPVGSEYIPWAFCAGEGPPASAVQEDQAASAAPRPEPEEPDPFGEIDEILEEMDNPFGDDGSAGE